MERSNNTKNRNRSGDRLVKPNYIYTFPDIIVAEKEYCKSCTITVIKGKQSDDCYVHLVDRPSRKEDLILYASPNLICVWKLKQ